jgi:hypothetical protein
MVGPSIGVEAIIFEHTQILGDKVGFAIFSQLSGPPFHLNHIYFIF